MAVDWSLGQGSQLNGLEALQYFGKAQDGAQKQRAAQQQAQREEALRQQIAGAYDPATGAVNSRQIEGALLGNGDIDGYKQYHSTLQGKEQEAAKLIGQLALAADTPEKWDQSIDYLVSHGAAELQAYKGQFSEQNRMAALAAGGLYDEYMASKEPKYIPVGEQGVVNVRDPNALAALAASQGQPAAAPAQPRAAAPSNVDVPTLQRQAQEAIAKGADPVAVNARLQSMIGGAGSSPRTFP